MPYFSKQNVSFTTEIVVVFNFTRDKDISSATDCLRNKESSCPSAKGYFLNQAACKFVVLQTSDFESFLYSLQEFEFDSGSSNSPTIPDPTWAQLLWRGYKS